MKDIIIPVSPRELDCISDKLSVRSQSNDRQPAHSILYTLYLGADGPVGRIISLWSSKHSKCVAVSLVCNVAVCLRLLKVDARTY